jgi:hypothetical protein
VEQGWVSEPDTEEQGIVLTKAVSAAELRLTTVERSADNEPQIIISTVGPCVLTEGPNSDEVVLLERSRT